MKPRIKSSVILRVRSKLDKTVRVRSKLDEKIETIERPPVRTEWFYSKHYISSDGDEPKDRRHLDLKYTYFFKCPHCNKVRQLIESNNLECGKVLCKCGSTFRVITDGKRCPLCKFLMLCLSKGIVQIKRKKLCDVWAVTT